MIRGPLHHRLVVVAAIAAATLVALGPLLVLGFPASGWDSAHHAMTARQFSDQLRGGELYPRWLIDRNYGLGSPHLFYYAPLSYYVSSLLDFGRDPTGLAPLARSAFVLLFLSGLTCHAWLRRVVDPIPALAGSVLYVALPYHVFVDLFIRGAYAEFSTFVWLPVPMLGVELLRERRAAGLPVLALGFAGMVLSNILTAPIFAAVPTVYAAGRTWGDRRLGRVALAAAGTALGLSISAAYLWPALTQQAEVSVPVTSIPPEVLPLRVR